MKTIFYLPALAMLCFLVGKKTSFNLIIRTGVDDSSIVNHVLDGSIKEWPSGKFKTDDATGIQYAIDNDTKYLFLAMSIPELRTQLKMMRMGMSMYIDLKGKKKESRGIEFPVKNGNSDGNTQGFSGRTGQQNEQQRSSDIITMRKMLAFNLVEMKVFGFSENDPDDQQLLLPGSANIAFAWDSANVMHIEYLIPFSMFGDILSLNQKDISIGWSIHAFELPKRNEGSENSSMENQSSGRRGGFGGGGGHRSGGYGGSGSNRYSQADREKMMEDQKFWTKYVINILDHQKTF